MNVIKHSMLVSLLILGCGGTKSSAGPKAPGDTEATSTSGSAADTSDVAGNTDEAGNDEASDPASSDAGAASAGEQPLVTFKLNNTHSEDLVFSMDKGWQPVLFAFTGKRPNAKGVILFPKFCTASCDAGEDAICPYCPQPEKVKEIKAAEKREVVAAGSSVSVPWDGQIYEYEKARGTQNGKRTRCECYRAKPAPPDTYTVRSCGLRITTSAKKSTKYQCVEKEVTLPPDSPTVIELEFPKP